MDNHSDKDIEFLCSGMTESVINALTKIGAFRVKSRNDVLKYKNQKFDFNQIRNDLNVIIYFGIIAPW